MSDISLTPSMRTNLLSLQGTSKLMDMTQSRISTGLKVGSALDNPTSYFTAKGLSNSASDFATLKDGMGQGISTIQAADKALTSIQSLVDQMKGLTASAKAASTSAERSALASQYDDLRGQVDKLASDASYNGKNLVNGRGAVTGGSFTVGQTGTLTQYSSANTTVTGATEEVVFKDVNITKQYTKASAVQTAGTFMTAGTTADVMTTLVGDAATGTQGYLDFEVVSLTLKTDASANIYVQMVDSDGVTTTTAAQTMGTTATSGAVNTLSFDVRGLQVDVLQTVDSTTPDLDVINANASEAIVFSSLTDVANYTASVTLNGVTETDTQVYGAGNINFAMTSTDVDWKSAAMNLGFTAGNAMKAGEAGSSITYLNTTGVGANDVTTNFNNDSTAFVKTLAVDVSATGLGISAAASNWVSDANIDAAITQLTAATTAVRSNSQSLATNLGIIQTRENFTSEFINVLQAGADKLTQADTNEEAANMLALQTRQQLGIQSLSMASQAAQSVLGLFR